MHRSVRWPEKSRPRGESSSCRADCATRHASQPHSRRTSRAQSPFSQQSPRSNRGILDCAAPVGASAMASSAVSCPNRCSRGRFRSRGRRLPVWQSCLSRCDDRCQSSARWRGGAKAARAVSRKCAGRRQTGVVQVEVTFAVGRVRSYDDQDNRPLVEPVLSDPSHDGKEQSQSHLASLNRPRCGYD